MNIASFGPVDAGFHNIDEVARETRMNDNVVVAAVQTAVAGKVDCKTVVRDVSKSSCFDSVIDELSSVDSRQG